MAKRGKSATDVTKLVTLFVIAAAVAALAVIGWNYYRASVEQTALADSDGEAAVSVDALMKPGPLEEMVMGSDDAPNTIVEYASMTCSHCAKFQTDVFPEVKTKYIDTGKAKYILREFPLDTLALAAFMLARCAGPDRYYPMVDALFETQQTWAVSGAEGKDKLLQIARQAGFSKESFDKCLADTKLADSIVEIRGRANEEFGVNSTPTFFVNGTRVKGGHTIEQFDAVLEGSEETAGASPSGQ